MAAISDIVMEAFAMESALLRTERTEKMAARSGSHPSEDRVAHAATMTRLHVRSRM